MKPTSAEYKVDVAKDFRNRSYCEVELDMIENIETNIDVTSETTQLDYSNIDLVNHEPRQYISFATLEQDRLKLDGSTSVYHTEYAPLFEFNAGYISSEVSDENGEFENNPTITITFDEPVSFYGLTIWGDLFTKEAIKNATILASGDDFDMSGGVLNNKNVNCLVNIDFKNVTEITIEIEEVAPHTRARVGYIDFGIAKIYSNDELMDNGVRIKSQADPLSRELSQQSLEFTIDNYDHDFNIDNPQGLYNRLKTNLPVRAKLGYELDDDGIEWINMGTYRLSEWNIETYKATFKAVGLLNTLNDNYYSSFYTTTNTLPEISMSEIIDDIGNISIIYDISNNITMTGLIDIMPKNHVIQYISNLLSLIAITDTDNYNNERIYIIDYNTKVDYNLDKDKYMEDSLNVELEENLKAVEVKYYTYSISSTQQDIFKDRIAVDEENISQKILFDKAYAKVTYTSSVKSGNPTITNSNITSTYAEFMFEGQGEIEITIKGYGVEKSENIYKLDVSNNGETATFDNPLITSLALAKNVAQNIKNFLTKRQKYSFDYVGEPMLEVGDTINFESQFTSGLNLLITKNEIAFNGGLSGKIEGKVV